MSTKFRRIYLHLQSQLKNSFYKNERVCRFSEIHLWFKWSFHFFRKSEGHRTNTLLLCSNVFVVNFFFFISFFSRLLYFKYTSRNIYIKCVQFYAKISKCRNVNYVLSKVKFLWVVPNRKVIKLIWNFYLLDIKTVTAS